MAEQMNDKWLKVWNGRPDLQKAYPEVADKIYVNYLGWVNLYGKGEYPDAVELDPKWLLVWKSRPDLRSTYPEVLHGDYARYLGWVNSYGQGEYPKPEFFPTEASIAAAAAKAPPPPTVTPVVPPAPTPLPPLIEEKWQKVWDARKDLQKEFPEVADRDYSRYRKWIAVYGEHDYPTGIEVEPKWLRVWKARKDLQKEYPEVIKGDLSRYVKWVLGTGVHEYPKPENFPPEEGASRAGMITPASAPTGRPISSSGTMNPGAKPTTLPPHWNQLPTAELLKLAEERGVKVKKGAERAKIVTALKAWKEKVEA